MNNPMPSAGLREDLCALLQRQSYSTYGARQGANPRPILRTAGRLIRMEDRFSLWRLPGQVFAQQLFREPTS